MSISSTLPSAGFRPLFLLVLAAFALIQTGQVLGQSSASQQANHNNPGIHAGWQMGPVALHTERHQSFGTHNLGNTGYGQALTIQTALNGPWEIEMKAGRSAIVMDDAAMRGWKTEVQSGTVMVNWVWEAAGSRRDAHTRFATISRGFQPFIGIGLSHVDHVMKQDLEDAFGRKYHLWSDGTLRDLDEAGDHGGNANILRRDYTYESDVANADGVRGPGRSVAIPAQIGVRLDVSPRVRARLGIGGWLGLTDDLDDQESGRMLSGDALASGFFGLGIRLGRLKKKPAAPPTVPGVSMEDAALLAAMDTDRDGISNLHDRCPGTEAGVEVDASGCPVDTDGDGYADYKDAEIHSPHIDVDGRGVAIAWGEDADGRTSSDKSGWDVVTGQVTSDDRTQYTLNIPTPAEGWTLAEQHTLLAFEHLTESENGMTVKVSADPHEAGRAVHTVRAAGLEAELIAPEAEAVVEMEGDAPKQVEAEPGHFRVQMGAYRTPDPAALNALFDGIEVLRFKGEDGLLRIVSPTFEHRSEAVAYQVQLAARGFAGAFVTEHAPEGTSKVSASEEALPEGDASDSPQFDADKIEFRIQLGALKAKMGVDAMDGLLRLGDIEHRSTTGWHRYLYGRFSSASEARKALPLIREAGFEDAFVVGDVSGRIIPLAEAEILLNQD